MINRSFPTCMARLRYLVLLSACLILPAHAQEVIPDFYRAPGLDSNRSFVNQNFSEHIDPFNGSLQLHYIDILVPGNGGFDLKVVRSYNSAAVSESNPGGFFGSAGVGWTMHFGRVIYKSAIGPCGGGVYPDVLNDPILELPDGSTQILAKSTAAGVALVSSQRFRAECVGGAVVIYAPDGTQYLMNHVVGLGGTPQARTGLYPTKITDRNNNSATITYATGLPEIQTVVTSEGHRLDYSYHPLAAGEFTRRVQTIRSRDSTGDHVFTYGYTAIAGFLGQQLTSVTRPDGLQWRYQYNGDKATSGIPGGFQLSSVAYPDGGTITYSYGTTAGDYVNFDAYSSTTPQNRSSVVKLKQTSDSGTWTFSYSPGQIGTYDTTTVNTPSGLVTYKHVGPNYATSGSLWMVGLLMQKQIGAIQTETYSWSPQQVSSQQFKRPGLWLASRMDSVTNAPVLASRTIVRDGATYTTSFSNYDDYGNARTVVESGPNGGSRTTTLTYYTNPSLWIIKQVKDQLISGGGVQLTRSVDSVGNVTGLTRDGVSTGYVLNADGTVQRTTFPRGLVHNYSAYKRGIPQIETQPEGISIARTVTDSGNLVSETNGRGHTTSYLYDGLNRVIRITPPRGGLTTIAHSQTTKTATRGALVETTVYDGFGRPTSITLGGISRTYRYDALGRMTFASNPGSSTEGTSYQYDILDRVSVVTNADSTTVRTSYGAGTKSVRDERGNSTTYGYRGFGDPGQLLLMSITAPDAAANITVQRNTKDLITSINQGGFVRSYGYDARGYLTSVVNPETGLTSYGRDDANNMTARTVGASGPTTFGYDGQNRMSSITYPAGTPSVTKSYTKTHRIDTVSSSAATRSFLYDENDNLTTEALSVDGLTFYLGYSYNSNDQLSSLTYPVSNRSVSYVPDVLGRPTRVPGFVTSVAYHPSGQISQVDYANNAVSVYGQNSRLWPSSFQVSRGASAYISSSYGYDGAGNLTSISDSVDPGYNRGLGYDAINRLASVNGPWGAGTIGYDGAGNLRSQSFGAATLSYGYDSSNRLSAVSGLRSASYSYDPYGNIVGTGNQTYSFNSAPNMTCANCNDAATAVQFQYDGLGNRVWTQRDGVRTYEFYGFNGSLLAEYTPALSNRLAEHIYLGGKRIASVGPAPTAIGLPASSLNAIAGQAVTLTATITGGAAPTGTVKFFDGSMPIGTAMVSASQASVTTTFQSIGPHQVTAVYSGDVANLGSTTSASAYVLSATTVGGPAGGQGFVAVAGKQVNLAATISGNSPTGTVSYYIGSTLLGTATLVSGTATLSTTFPTPGTYVVTVTYSGDANNAASSATVTLRVNIPPEQLIPILQLLLDD